MADEFRLIRDFHDEGSPYSIKTKVAVLHSWGALRSWTLSGHFHETYMHELIHINEALSGLPIDVSFISLRIVLPVIKTFLKPGQGQVLCLIKPQFEAGKEKVGTS